MKRLITALFLLTYFKSYSQFIAGKLINSDTRLPLQFVLVTSGSGGVFSSSDGQFALKISNSFDTVRINCMGYRPFKLAANQWGSSVKTITLEVMYKQLGEVTITGRRNYQTDSVALRQQYAREFNFRGPRFNEIVRTPSKYVPFAFVTIDIGNLVKAINKKHLPQYRLQQVLLRDERESHVSARFTKKLVSGITRLQGDSLEWFMSSFRPSAAALDKLSDYDLVIYLKANLEKFRTGGINSNVLPQLLKPGQSLE